VRILGRPTCSEETLDLLSVPLLKGRGLEPRRKLLERRAALGAEGVTGV
jgi:hypothetical protein